MYNRSYCMMHTNENMLYLTKKGIKLKLFAFVLMTESHFGGHQFVEFYKILAARSGLIRSIGKKLHYEDYK